MVAAWVAVPVVVDGVLLPEDGTVVDPGEAVPAPVEPDDGPPTLAPSVPNQSNRPSTPPPWSLDDEPALGVAVGEVDGSVLGLADGPSLGDEVATGDDGSVGSPLDWLGSAAAATPLAAGVAAVAGADDVTSGEPSAST